MSECIFCQIIQKKIPAQVVYEDDQILAFRDIHPKASVHVLVVPKKHIDNLMSPLQAEEALLGYLTARLAPIAANLGLTEGFRTVINTGSGGGQEVYHLHYHILGGSLPRF